MKDPKADSPILRLPLKISGMNPLLGLVKFYYDNKENLYD